MAGGGKRCFSFLGESGLLSGFGFGEVRSVDSPAVNPWNFLPELTAQVDGRWVKWILGGFRPEFELIASTTTLVAVVAAHRYVHRERASMLGLGFV